MRRLVLGLAALALALLGILLVLSRDPAPRSRAEKRTEAVDEPAAVSPQEPVAAPPAAPRWSLSGLVTEWDGNPIAGASVDTGPLGSGWAGPPDTVLSEETGRYEIDLGAFRSGERFRGYVQAAAPGYLPGCSFFEIEAGPADRAVEITRPVILRKGVGVSGRVVDSSGRPVGGAQVTLLSAGNLSIAGISISDGSGRFRVGARAAGTYGVSARAPGYREGRSGLLGVPDAGAEAGDVVLPDGLVVEGHVRYADGQPVAGASLWLPIEGIQRWGEAAVAAPDGSFRLTGLDPGRRKIVVSGWLGSDGPEAAVEVPAMDVLLTVRGGRIRLRVVDEHQELLAGAAHFVYVGEVKDLALWSQSQRAGAEVSYFAPHGTRLVFAAEADGRIPAEQAIDVPSDRNESEVLLRLVPIVPTARLRIELTAAPATPFHARLLTPVGRRPVMVLNHDGASAPVLRVPPGTWHLVVQPGESVVPFFEPVETPVEVAPDRENVVRLDTPANGRIRLEVKVDPFFMAGFKGTLVRAEDGTEIPLKEFAERPGTPWGYALEANKSALARPLLRPGLYQVRVELPSHERYETTIRVEPQVVTDVVAEMVRQKE